MASWSVVRIDEWDEPCEVLGSFLTKEEAEAYALRSFYLGREAWEHKPVSGFTFKAVPWTPKGNQGFYKGEG
jgi:hypothetical protein